MKILAVQIKSSEAILVVLKKNDDGLIFQTNESTKFQLADHSNSNQVKQFRDQINAAFDTIEPDRIIILARNANGKGRLAPSPVSFKLEGIMQLYTKKNIEFMWPQTISAYLKKEPIALKAENKYQQDALHAAYIIIKE